jgi:hypothetical protein
MRPDLSLVLLGVALAIVTPRDALAYLDPGTGSLILSMAVAGFFSAVFTLKTYWHRLKGLFRGVGAKDTSPAGTADERK